MAKFVNFYVNKVLDHAGLEDLHSFVASILKALDLHHQGAVEMAIVWHQGIDMERHPLVIGDMVILVVVSKGCNWKFEELITDVEGLYVDMRNTHCVYNTVTFFHSLYGVF